MAHAAAAKSLACSHARTLNRAQLAARERQGRTAPPRALPTNEHSGEAVDQRKNPELYAGGVEAPSAAAAQEHAGPHDLSADAQSSSATALHLPLLRKPEVLAPAGGWPQLRAAVECGADAVYFGVTDLNARARASNFTPEELPEVMTYLHQRGAKGYIVLNVLVFDSELATLAQRAQQAAAAGVDAVIVQDVGAVELIRAAAPGLPVHGSTQMTITSAEGAAFAASRGIDRVVVGRELSIRDIASVSSGGGGAEVEAFVHGALCVSYSGQCFSSEAWGGRSANRGQCAQACRLDYGMVVDGTVQVMGDVKYLLSPQDLAAVELVPDLVRAGVVSFKIEGERMRREGGKEGLIYIPFLGGQKSDLLNVSRLYCRPAEGS